MEIYFYKAGCADAARLTYIGTDGRPHHIFIDSGYERTYRNVLKDEISDIRSRGESIDLWIISHIHDDHIGGALNYIYDIQQNGLSSCVKRWLYNSPRPLSFPMAKPQISSPSSIKQGDRLTAYLNSRGESTKTAWINSLEMINIESLKITILSPDQASLSRLRETYSQHYIQLESTEYPTGSLAKSQARRDYHLRAETINLSDWREDGNVDNRSSLAVLTESTSSKVLWLADAHPSVISAALRKLGFRPENQLYCDIVKVAHHGSSGNNSDELYSLINSTNFVICADGVNHHGLPTKQCMIRILKNPYRDLSKKYTFHFTNDDQILRSIFTIDGESIFEELNFNIQYLTNGNYLYFPLAE